MGRKTALFEEHKKLGATIVDFAGWEMPVYYSTPLKEHLAVRESAGLFDTSHMGEIFIEGKETLNFIQYILSRDCSTMKNGEMILGVLCNEKGGIIDDLTAYRFGEEKFMLVVNAGRRNADFEWIAKHAKGFDCKVEGRSDEFAKIDIQGPKSEHILQKIAATSLNKLGYYEFAETEVAKVEAIVSRSGYTGEDGFEIYFAKKDAAKLWNSLLEAGKDFGIAPCGLAARDTLRLECCMALYGHELSEKKTPLQGAYGWAVDFEKEDFIGKEALLAQKSEGVKEKLVAFEMVGRAIAREGCPIMVNGKKAGVVTSGNFSPTLKKNIGLGYIGVEASAPDTEFEVEVRGKPFKAKVVKKPFYRRDSDGKS